MTPSTHRPMPIGTSIDRRVTATQGISSVSVATTIVISFVIAKGLIAGGLTVSGLTCSLMIR